ncbi:hypothetical protein DSO57_1030134 [Entomophthora muscae]|uniref:Uncharacterized protein n=1 Tax=Entomophthora muscae TaxID=34485 RepID=A0ACC2RFN3_9FUNG|nr:hypothetical protein DSO57_1030134 [Entomophthora muscae]
MHPVLGLLLYIPYNLILERIISGRWGPASGTLLAAPQNVNFMPANFVAPPSIPEDENWVTSQCPEFYSEDALMLFQVIYLGLLCVRIDNSLPLEPQAQERELNPEPGFPRAYGLRDCRTACIFLGLGPRELTLKIMAHSVKQIELRKLLH